MAMLRSKHPLTLSVCIMVALALLLAACGADNSSTILVPTILPKANLKNVAVGQQSQGQNPAHVEPFLAVNPQNSNNLLGVAMFFPSVTSFFAGVSTFVSLNAGLSWHDNGSLPMPAGFPIGFGATVAFNAQGTGFILAGISQDTQNQAVNRVVLWRTDDSGRSFSKPVTVAQGSQYNHPWLAIDQMKGTLYLAWTSGTTIVFSRSTDNGHSFTAPLVISSSHDIQPDVPIVTLGLVGTVYVVYSDLGQLGVAGVPLSVAVSSDQGHRFSSPRAIRGAMAATQAHDRFPTTIAAATDPQDGSLYVAFAASRTSGNGENTVVSSTTDVLVTRSTDKGQTWSIPVRVDKSDLSSQDDSFEPQLAVTPTGTVFVSYFMFYATSGLVDVFLAQSTTHGTSFPQDQKVTTTAWDPYQGIGGRWLGNYQGLALGPDKVYPCWNDSRSGQLEIFTAAVPYQ